MVGKRVLQGVTDSSHVWTPDFGDKPGDHLGDTFGDEIWDLKGSGIFAISLLGEKIRHEYARSYKESAWTTECVVGRLGSPWSANVFGVLSSVRASKLLDAER
ncbi:hypothetical protein AVEN_21060-1 [Araneus ventricosus]|uniref:Uncharacterized protein n=1 Tax=Araneus ventricosus TaxID=182803 RepID=A0A4Y1ZJS8_ARAVE|nr:hypothetical protein AVEN_11768-1 [Araneus ventricosus]GBL53511.1 hypothetical protein AVEN_21060-1 [Araneus ventricosus]